MSFIIYALPRSRTAWLARFLTYGDWFCGHDEARHLRSMDDIKSWLSMDNTGTVETAAAPFWRTAYRPDVRVAVVRRPVDEVVDSLMRLGPFDRAGLTAFLRRLDRKLDQIEQRVQGVLSVSFADLATEAGCARLFEHCLPYKHDPQWWASLAPVNIQVNLPAVFRHYKAHEPQLLKMAAQVKCLTLAEFNRQPFHEMDAITIREEDWATFVRDGQSLIAEHLVKVGEPPDHFAALNTELFSALDKAGSLQIMTGRCNGRMFGYLITIISPSLMGDEVISGVPTGFFASPEFPGLGMQLQRASQAALRERGATEVIFRAGVRGDGPRLGRVYQRMGAEPFGQLYRLPL